MTRRLLPPALACCMIALTLWAYANIAFLRGTLFWEFRFVVLLVCVFLLLSLIESMLTSILPAKPDHGEEK